MSLRALYAYLPKLKHYLIAAVLVFIAGSYIGYHSPEQFQFILNDQQDRLKQLADSISKSDHRTLALFGVILENNVLTAAIMLFSGAFFMVLPVYFLLTNGAMLGYMANKFASGDSLSLFLRGTIPHGIFEIPAVLAAAACGIRLGVLVMRSLIALPYPNGRVRAFADLGAFMKLMIPLVLTVVVVLALAALIESTVTPWIAGQ